jgi:hypothetical protein
VQRRFVAGPVSSPLHGACAVIMWLPCSWRRRLEEHWGAAENLLQLAAMRRRPPLAAETVHQAAASATAAAVEHGVVLDDACARLIASPMAFLFVMTNYSVDLACFSRVSVCKLIPITMLLQCLICNLASDAACRARTRRIAGLAIKSPPAPLQPRVCALAQRHSSRQ